MSNKVKTSVNLAPELYEALVALSEQEHRSRSAYIEYLIHKEQIRLQRARTLVDPGVEYETDSVDINTLINSTA